MIKNLTDTMVVIEGKNMRAVIWLYIEEVNQGEFSVAGNPLTAVDVDALQKN